MASLADSDLKEILQEFSDYAKSYMICTKDRKEQLDTIVLLKESLKVAQDSEKNMRLKYKENQANIMQLQEVLDNLIKIRDENDELKKENLRLQEALEQERTTHKGYEQKWNEERETIVISNREEIENMKKIRNMEVSSLNREINRIQEEHHQKIEFLKREFERVEDDSKRTVSLYEEKLIKMSRDLISAQSELKNLRFLNNNNSTLNTINNDMWILDSSYRDFAYRIAAGAGITSLIVVVAFRIYLLVTSGICKSKKNMNGKTVIITGANSGIGMETALDLAKRGARVIMACRNMSEGTRVRNNIAREAKNDNVVVRKLDLSSVESIREFATEINWREPRLDVLIHNAGMANTFSKKVTSDGFEVTFMTNMFGPFLLTHLLIDLLKKSAPSRIVVVASELYRLANVNMENPNPTSSLPAYLYYSSKYANILFTRELARKLEGTGVTANCLHPGMVDSGIWRNVPFPLNLPLKVITKFFFKTPEEGAQTTIHLAVADEVKDINGKYFMDCREHGLSSGVSDMGKAAKYWEILEGLILKPSDPRI